MLRIRRLGVTVQTFGLRKHTTFLFLNILLAAVKYRLGRASSLRSGLKFLVKSLDR
jgi:hypothetical protein